MTTAAASTHLRSRGYDCRPAMRLHLPSKRLAFSSGESLIAVSQERRVEV